MSSTASTVDPNLQDITSNASASINNAASNGQNAINNFNPTTISATNANTQGSLYGPNGSQTAQNQNYMQMYQNSIANNPTATQLYNSANTQFNVPTLENNATQLNNAVLNAPQQVLNTAKGFNYDNNQVGNQTDLDLTKLSPLATAATNSANTAEGLASNEVQAGLSQNATNLLPVQAYGNNLTQQMAEQGTGLDQNQTDTLNALVQQMNAGVTLSTAQMQQLESLSAAEESAQASIQNTNTSANAGIEEANIGQQYKTVNPSQTVYDTQTGATYTPIGTNNLSGFINTLQQPAA